MGSILLIRKAYHINLTGSILFPITKILLELKCLPETVLPTIISLYASSFKKSELACISHRRKKISLILKTPPIEKKRQHIKIKIISSGFKNDPVFEHFFSVSPVFDGQTSNRGNITSTLKSTTKSSEPIYEIKNVKKQYIDPEHLPINAKSLPIRRIFNKHLQSVPVSFPSSGNIARILSNTLKQHMITAPFPENFFTNGKGLFVVLMEKKLFKITPVFAFLHTPPVTVKTIINKQISAVPEFSLKKQLPVRSISSLSNRLSFYDKNALKDTCSHIKNNISVLISFYMTTRKNNLSFSSFMPTSFVKRLWKTEKEKIISKVFEKKSLFFPETKGQEKGLWKKRKIPLCYDKFIQSVSLYVRRINNQSNKHNWQNDFLACIRFSFDSVLTKSRKIQLKGVSYRNKHRFDLKLHHKNVFSFFFRHICQTLSLWTLCVLNLTGKIKRISAFLFSAPLKEVI